MYNVRITLNIEMLKPLILIGIIVILMQCVSKQEYILDEPFDTNKLGWVEEQTDYHFLEISHGGYFIHSIDTASDRSSSGSISRSYLYDLPKKYEIATSLKLVEKKRDETNFGILLSTATLEYTYSFYTKGEVVVSEYNYNADSTVNLISEKIDLLRSDKADIVIKINEMDFKLFVNDVNIGEGKFRTKTSAWYDLRLYTSAESSIVVDYLRIKSK